MAYERGQTGVIVPVPDAGPAVDRLRQLHDPSAAVGAPAHVTVTFPFLPESVLTEHDLAALGAVAAAQPVFSVTFATTGRFPGVSYLHPEPDRPFHELTAALLRRWPQAPPYGGVHGLEPEPHLTLAAETPEDVLDDVERELADTLPITVAATGLAVLVFDGDRWRQRAFLPFAPTLTPFPSPSPSE